MRRLSFLVPLIILIAALSFSRVIPLHAQTADELKANVDSLSAKIDALDKEIADYNKKISTTQGQAKTLKAALAQLELQRTTLVKEINRTKLQIQQTQTNIVTTQQQIGVTQSKLDQNKSALGETLRSAVYEDQTVPPIVRSLAVGAKFSDMLDALQRSSEISSAIRSKVDVLANTKQDLDHQQQVYVASKQKLESLTVALSDQKALVEQTSQQKNQLLVETNNKESEYQKMLADRKAKKDALEAEMLSVESKLKVIVDTSKLPKTGKGVLQYPVANVNITQYFGNTPFASANPQVYNGAGHNGVDFAAKIGTPIYAAADGTVVGTGNTDASCSGVSYGKWILIRHNNGLSSLYGHLSVIQVSAGDTVSSGQKIALSGNTGYSTGPHLHFTVYASDAVHIAGPTEYRSKVCGTYLIMPLAPRAGYLNPLSYL